jgi:hypothetical protein
MIIQAQFLSVFVPTGTFGNGVLSGKHRKPYVLEPMGDDPYARTGRIDLAPFGRSVNGGADNLASPAAVTLVRINLDCLDCMALTRALDSLNSSRIKPWVSMAPFPKKYPASRISTLSLLIQIYTHHRISQQVCLGRDKADQRPVGAERRRTA